MSRRTERVASLIRNILAKALQTEISDPRLPTITSITRVDVSPDFSVATVYVSALANETRCKLAVDALRSSAGHLRRLLGEELTLRKLPALVFKLDEGFRRGQHTIELIERLMPSAAPPGDDEAASEGPDQATPPDDAPRSPRPED